MKNTTIRTGRNASEVKRQFVWENPQTVVDSVRYNGGNSIGQKEYLVFYHDRKVESKRSRRIKELKAKGAKYGKVSARK